MLGEIDTFKIQNKGKYLCRLNNTQFVFFKDSLLIREACDVLTEHCYISPLSQIQCSLILEVIHTIITL